MVQFESSLGDTAKHTLIKSSPLKALDRFASVNAYGPHFDPCKQGDFLHLATVYIAKGSPQIYEYLSYVVAPIGRLIRSKIAPGSVSHRISAIVETTLKKFLSKATTTILYDFGGRNLRCGVCFSYQDPLLGVL